MNKPHWMQPGCGVPVLAAAAARCTGLASPRGARLHAPGDCGRQGAVRNMRAARSAAAGLVALAAQPH
jgi:hypothetical protein